MKLRELRIQNFRSFKDETIQFDDYTCFVGPNQPQNAIKLPTGEKSGLERNPAHTVRNGS